MTFKKRIDSAHSKYTSDTNPSTKTTYCRPILCTYACAQMTRRNELVNAPYSNKKIAYVVLSPRCPLVRKVAPHFFVIFFSYKCTIHSRNILNIV